MFGIAVKPMFEMPTSHIKVSELEFWFPSSLQLFANKLSGKRQGIAQVLGSLPTMWETHIEFLTPGFGLAQLRQTSGK